MAQPKLASTIALFDVDGTLTAPRKARVESAPLLRWCCNSNLSTPQPVVLLPMRRLRSRTR